MAHTPAALGPIVGRCAAASRQPRTTGQSQGGRVGQEERGRSPTRDTSHYGRVGGRSQPTSFVCVKKVWSPHHGPAPGELDLHTDPGLAGVRRGVTRRAPI